MTDHATIPTWPRIEAVTRPDGTGEVTINGTSHPIETHTTDDARAEILSRVTETARTLRRPVHLDARGPDGDWLLLVHPDGTVSDAGASTAKPAPSRVVASSSDEASLPSEPLTDATPAAASVLSTPPQAVIVHRVDHLTLHVDASRSTDIEGGLVEFTWDFGDGNTAHGVDAIHTYAAAGEYIVTLSVRSRSGLVSGSRIELHLQPADPTKLTDQERSEILSRPATWGFRGWSNRNLPGTRRPSARECRYRIRAAEEDKRRARRKALVNSNINRTMGYCAFVVVQSEKGGVGKSTTSALVAYFISKLRQEAVLLVDLNPDKTNLHGKLGVHPSHSLLDLVLAKDLIPARHQAKEYCTKVPGMNVYLLSNEVDAQTREQTSARNVVTMKDIVRPFFPIGVLDNGTGSRHPAMEGALSIGHSTLLVMENTRDLDEFVHSTLKRLETSDNPDLRKRVVIVVNTRVQPPVPPAPLPRGAEPDVVERHARMTRAYEGAEEGYVDPQAIVRKYRDIVRAVIVIPYDQALANSGVINFDALLPETEEAGEELARLAMEDLSEPAPNATKL